MSSDKARILTGNAKWAIKNFRIQKRRERVAKLTDANPTTNAISKVVYISFLTSTIMQEYTESTQKARNWVFNYVDILF